MINVKEYSGHIRNWSALCERLGIDHSLWYRTVFDERTDHFALSLLAPSAKRTKPCVLLI